MLHKERSVKNVRIGIAAGNSADPAAAGRQREQGETR
jgi:hypothetical protein